jgi:hypothetical protein
MVDKFYHGGIMLSRGKRQLGRTGLMVSRLGVAATARARRIGDFVHRRKGIFF